MDQKADGKPRCSFCGYGREDPATLIGSPSQVYICIECADLCREVFHEKGLIDGGEPWNFAGRRFRYKGGTVTGGLPKNTDRVTADRPKAASTHAFTATDRPIRVKEPSWFRRLLYRIDPRIDNKALQQSVYSLMIENRTLRRRVNELEEAKE
jgi:hypothetical protein